MNHRMPTLIFVLALMLGANTAFGQKSVAVPPPRTSPCLAEIRKVRQAQEASTSEAKVSAPYAEEKAGKYCPADAKAAKVISDYNAKSPRGGDPARDDFLKEIQVARRICATWKGTTPAFCGELLKLPEKLRFASSGRK